MTTDPAHAAEHYAMTGSDACWCDEQGDHMIPDPDRPYARKSFAEVLDDYVLVRGDLTEQYAREQLVREHNARLAELREDIANRIEQAWRAHRDAGNRQAAAALYPLPDLIRRADA